MAEIYSDIKTLSALCGAATTNVPVAPTKPQEIRQMPLRYVQGPAAQNVEKVNVDIGKAMAALQGSDRTL